jgi:SAM-dependent methyltransferase
MITPGAKQMRNVGPISADVNIYEFATATAEKAAYLDYWRHNAASLAAQGCYGWMAEQLDFLKPKRILDIGCGTGEGTLALFQRFSPDIVAIDENLSCLRQTHRCFRNHRAPADLRARFEYRQNPNGSHSTEINKVEIITTERVALLQADVLLEDPPLHSYLERLGPFDAITIWLIGAYQCRLTCADLYPLRITEPYQYRLHVQNRVYWMAGKLLRSGGILQVIDRGEPLSTPEIAEDHLNGHREQAELGGLQVQGFTARPYEEHATRKGVEMIISPGKSGRAPNLIEIALISVTSLKP